MNLKLTLKIFAGLLGLVLVGCATPKNYDSFRAAHPRSILVLPPKNNGNDMRATYSFLSTVTSPIAEMGYYVFPVAVVDQMMKENGVPSANEMHEVSLKKIKEIINPDAVLYITLEEYGTKFYIVQSETKVVATARLVSAANGAVLWEDSVYATDGSSGNQSIMAAIVSQVVNNSTDYAHEVAISASQQLFMTEGQGLMRGPYRPEAGE